MAHRKADQTISEATLPVRNVEHFAVQSRLLRHSQSLRLDASYFNPNVARALEILRRSGMKLSPLGQIVSRVFIPNRFKRIYVAEQYGLPFLQGSHIVHFQPADLKYISRRAHLNIEQWTIKEGWLCPGGYLYSFLSAPLGYIQLTAQIYGAVVDELTEDQAKSVLVPLPVNDEQRKLVEQINREACEAVATRSRAVTLIAAALEGIASLVPERRLAEGRSEGEARTGAETSTAGEGASLALSACHAEPAYQEVGWSCQVYDYPILGNRMHG